MKPGPRLALVAFAAAAVACSGSGDPPEPASPVAAPPPPADVLLITVDTLRPDALGWIGGGDHTPLLDRLAGEGFAFPAAVSPAPLTLPAHASLMTGLTPRRHGARDNGVRLGEGTVTLAELLRDRGFHTAAFVSGFPLAARFGLERGFEHYDDRMTRGEGAWSERAASETVAAARSWLEAARSPWLLWLHFYDPHYPYESPRALPGDRGRAAYDGEVAAVDAALAPLLGLAERRSAELLTVFAADHGESLGEHGEGTHGFFVYDSTISVPLVFRFPGRIAPGSSDAPARLIDVAPTVLELLAVEAPTGLDGVSVAPLIAGLPQQLPPALLEARQPWTSYGWAPLLAIRHDGWKLIAAPRPELYDLAADPGEEHDLYASDHPRVASLRRALRQLEASPPAAAEAVTDQETLARLRALGYTGGAAPSLEPPPGLPDPKDRVELRERLTAAEELLQQGNLEAAASVFEEVLRAEPGNRFALSRLGLARLRQGDPAAAIPPLAAVVEEAPDQPESRSLLAQALTLEGRLEEARDQWLELVRQQPRDAAGWSNLGAVLGRSGRPSDALAAFERALALTPADDRQLTVERQTRLAFAAAAAGETERAAELLLEVAEQVGEERFPHHGALGLLLARLGRGDEAEPWLARSRPGEGDFATARFELARRLQQRGDEAAARRALGEALAADPGLRRATAADPGLRQLPP